MITLHSFESLGGADHGWLNAKHHFSFGSYHDPAKMSFGELLVINDDLIAPQTGFNTHSHHDMEIITYVRKGAITHEDSKGNRGRTTAGNVQVMSAGTGIAHSEFNLEDEVTNIYQIWIKPRSTGLPPQWDSAEFPSDPATDGLTLLVSGDGSAPLTIQQDAQIHAGRMPAGTTISHTVKGKAYILISDGRVMVDGIAANRGDGIAVSETDSVNLHAESDCEVLVINIPGLVEAR